MAEVNSRNLAYKILYGVLEENKKSHIAINEAFLEFNPEKRDRKLITRIVNGTLERLITLDFMINELSKTKVDKQKPILRTILRMSVYQIMYMDSVPDSAAVNEAVKLLKKKGLTGLSGFANGVLRNLSRQKEDILEKAERNPVTKYSCPEWIVDYLLETYGESETEKILEGFLRNPDNTIRVNLSRTDAGTLVESLRNQGVTVTKGDYFDYSFHISDFDSLGEIKEFKEGLFVVQDESSMHVADKAGLKKRDLVVDVCSAPGGKACHAADILTGLGGGDVIARDLTERKVRLIQENIDKSGFTNIKAEVWDATVKDETLMGKCDVVFADLPCSGLGIIAKKPDIKFNMTQEQQEELVILQRQILDVVTGYVKPGGTLMYSTCTINKKENEENVAYIESKGFEVEYMKQFLPGIDACDGFFVAKLTKK